MTWLRKCDGCGVTASNASGWKLVKIETGAPCASLGHEQYDVCPDCLKKVEEVFKPTLGYRGLAVREKYFI
jgi:hypothetical protein